VVVWRVGTRLEDRGRTAGSGGDRRGGSRGDPAERFDNHRPRLAFIAPVLFFLAIALLAYAWFGLQSAESKHIIEAFGALPICLSPTFLPYWRRLL
jgi:hypothetical protein